MPVQADFSLGSLEDGSLTVGLIPAANVSGWTLQFSLWRRQQAVSGSVSGLITKSAASGFNNVSGINVTNGPGGVFVVNLGRFDVSGGLAPGAYSYKVERMDSGNATIISEGYRLVKT